MLRAGERLSAMLYVVGIGSQHGDDAIGLMAAAELDAAGLVERFGREQLQIFGTTKPATDLMACLGDAQGLILIDAVRDGAEPGSVRRLLPAQIEQLVSSETPAKVWSSHGLGVTEILALAQATGLLPAAITVFCVSVAECGAGDMPAADVRQALGPLCDAVTAEIDAQLGKRTTGR